VKPPYEPALAHCAAAVAVSALLLGLLLLLLDAEAGRIAALLRALPWTLVLAVAAIEAVLLITGALKWRLSVTWFRPDVGAPSLWRSIEATGVGSLLAQVLPAQLATASARVLMQRHHAGAGMAAFATFYEQLFDLLALSAVAAISAVLLLGAEPGLAAATGALATLGSVLGSRLVFRLAGKVSDCLVRRARRHAPWLESLPSALHDASRLPQRLAVALTVLSVLRIACLGTRAVLIFAVLTPAASPVGVAIAFPVVHLATVLTAMPGAFGTMEWAWTGALFAAGASAGDAAAAAIVFRVIAFSALMVVLAPVTVVLAMRLALLITRRRADRKLPDARV